ncbi:MAG: double-strand break repair protein AddB [Hyphomicrobiales bacterium]|nr:double-strand break repair protein AddB [Hyphomicrobiales bacterium]
MRRPRVFSIAPGAGFLRAFVDALLEGALIPNFSRASGPLSLADATIYLPTRRAARALSTEFARAARDGAILLPSIRPLGDFEDEAEALLAAPGEGAFLAPPPVSALERRLFLTQAALAFARQLRSERIAAPGLAEASPAEAFALAAELARLIDEFALEGADWSAVGALVADEYDDYWRLTTRFLNLAMREWPAHLQAIGRVDAVDGRIRAVEREIARLQARAPRGPVIVAGSTGTSAPTAQLMAAVARLPQGAVVLPGLDIASPCELFPDPSASDPSYGHPQAALARLLQRLEISREDVVALGAPSAQAAARARFVAAALSPGEATAGWRGWRAAHADDLKNALRGLTVLQAADETEEALAIALVLRAALEQAGKTAALVTPDRAIARRVRAELFRWGVVVDDSGGEPLGQTPAGVFARLALAAADGAPADVDLVALLGHPLAAPRADRKQTGLVRQNLEIAVLRATFPDADWRARLDLARADARDNRHAHRAAKRLDDEDWRQIETLLEATLAALQPLRETQSASLPVWASLHRDACAQLSAHAAVTGEDADLLEQLFGEIAQTHAGQSLALTLPEYAAMFAQLVAEPVLRGPQNAHPRLKILGLLEARLLDADCVVLAGLDESVWPPQARTDAFLNRPMRAALGLPPPERRIGQSAHDFVMALGAPEAVLTRAAKRGGAPATPSRFLQRLQALGGDDYGDAIQRGAAWLDLARGLDRPDAVRPAPRPAPRPPLALRPAALSVTQIEKLRRDPYAIYADKILKLQPLGALDATPGAADYGQALHATLQRLADEWPHGPLPDDAHAQLLASARERLAQFLRDPAWSAFGAPKVENGLAFILQYERARRPHVALLHGEIEGRWRFTLDNGAPFLLYAKADRIEVASSGLLRIVDYKTGAAPSQDQVLSGLAPQLTLEAAMALEGAFDGLAPAGVESLLYLKLGGAKGGESHDPLKVVRGRASPPPLADVIADHVQQLRAMLDSYADAQRGYPSRPMMQFVSSYGDYDHLARVKEWSAVGGAAGEEGEP